MTNRGRCYRRPLFYGSILVALVTLAVPVSQSIAGARSNTATAPIKRHTFSCGFPGDKKVIGTAKFTRTKSDSIIVDITVYGADSTGDYSVRLFSNEPYYCSDVHYLGDFKVVNGHFHKVFEVTGVSEDYNQFYVVAYNNTSGYYDVSPLVTI